MAFRILAVTLLFVSVSHGDFLALNIVEKEDPPPFFVYGAHYTGRLFADGIDNFGGLNAHLRIKKKWAIGAKADWDFTRSGFVAGAFGHYFPTGELFKESAENFVHFGLAYVKIEGDDSPLFSIGYGRDMLPWKKSPFGFRVMGRLDYAPFERVFSREGEGIFGINMTKLANTAFAIEVGIFGY